jgi:hypothetical protein
MSMMIPALLNCVYVLFYVWFIYTEPARLAFQRRWIRYVRRALALIFRDEPQAEDLSNGGLEWESPLRMRVMMVLWLCFKSMGTGLNLLQGNWVPSIVLLANTGVLALLLKWKAPRENVLTMFRVKKYLVVVNTYLVPSQDLDMFFIRSVVSRAIMSILFFESIEEGFADMLIMSVLAAFKLGHAHSLVLLPMKVFFFAMLPLHLMGFGELVLVFRKHTTASSVFQR